MTRASAVLIVAGCAYLLSWFLPVTDGFPGWQAFRAALSPIWPVDTYGHQGPYYAAFFIASAFTNVVFVALLVDLATGRRLGLRPTVSILVVAMALNLYWLIVLGDDRADLRVGYYLWVCSFFFLIVGARVPAGSKPSFGAREE